MELSNILELLSGLGCFLFGMKYMGDGLQQAAGQKMRDLLEKLTRNRIMGFCLGLLVTCVIQSSAATTVMVMGFINASVMDLAQATGVIFGANLGTTITSILIALDVSAISPICIFVGVVLLLYGKSNNNKRVGQVILGFGILFMGLHTMSSAMSFLRHNEAFQAFIVTASNPILGVLIGILMAAIIQSSSAAVGILQALAMSGLMPLNFASFLICGINVGSSVPPIISALAAKNNAKRAAVIYTLFNVVGAVIIVPLTLLTPYTTIVANLVESPAFQVSLLHIIFKVVAAVVLLPFTNKVVDCCYLIIPKQEHESEYRFLYIDKNLNTTADVTILQLEKEIERMALLVHGNMTDAFDCVVNRNLEKATAMRDNEDLVDYLNHEMTDYLVDLNKKSIHTETAEYFNRAIHVISDLERISDYSINLLEKAERCIDQKIEFTGPAGEELSEICENLKKMYDAAIMVFFSRKYITKEDYDAMRNSYHKVVALCDQSESNHVTRLQNNECSTQAGIVFVKALNDFARIGDHTRRIARAAKEDYNG